MSDAPFFSIIIVNYNGGTFVHSCIESLQKQEDTDFEVVVVDNASADGSADSLPAMHALQLIRNADNLGFAAAVNQGAAAAHGQWLVLLNPDTIAEENWLSELRKGIAAHPEAMLFGSTQLALDEPGRVDGSGDRYSFYGVYWRGLFQHPVESLPTHDTETFSPCAAASAYRKDVFDTLGGMDERYFCYGEDVDLGFRFQLMGHRAVQLRHAIVYHAGSGISGRASDFTLRHGLRNQIWVYVKNMPGVLFWLSLPLHITYQVMLVMLYNRQDKFRVALAAVRDALCGISPVWQARQQIQKRRTASIWAIARQMCWHPLGPIQRK